MRRVPQFLAALALAVTAVVTTSPAPASAAPVTAPAKCPAFKLSDAVKEPLVFHARVTGPGKPVRKGGPVVYPVTVVKALKGVISGSNLQVTLNTGPCQRKSLTANEDYYFFVQQKGDTILAAGSSPRVEEYTDKLQAEIAKEFPEAVSPEPQQVSFSKPTSPEGAKLVEVAAPGVAMVVVGLLGLIIVQILGRRRTA
ncbi:hypothetical protein G5C66_06075 [Nocardioides sp. KC13]|uniref:Uncharacterized protein n=1 Tax=Nocardioides turkmenicus TaxID=2711220 RepID=A0A6M1R3N7_9ACTN|nr:hypothetical protein [Nocardioides sp. KC13]NGN92308.1 hypothetical protein [Nocardioides sp. KC13]